MESEENRSLPSAWDGQKYLLVMFEESTLDCDVYESPDNLYWPCNWLSQDQNQLSLPEAALSVAQKERILQRTRELFAGYPWEVVDHVPQGTLPHATVILTQQRSAEVMGGAIMGGAAQQVDCGDAITNDLAIVFNVSPDVLLSDRWLSSSADEAVTEFLAREIAHEAGHLVGLLHVDSKSSIMHPYASSFTGDVEWLDGATYKNEDLINCGPGLRPVPQDVIEQNPYQNYDNYLWQYTSVLLWNALCR